MSRKVSSITPSNTERFTGFNTAVSLTPLIAGLAPYALRAVSPDYAGLTVTQLAEVGLGSAFLGFVTIKGLELLYYAADIISTPDSKQTPVKSTDISDVPAITDEERALQMDRLKYNDNGVRSPYIESAENKNLPTAFNKMGGKPK